MSDEIRIGSVSGQGFQIGGHGNQQHNTFGATWPAEQATADPPVAEPGRGVPVSSLYAFADIVGYSKLSARLQKMSQDDLASLLDVSLAEAGIRPDLVEAQDQGDARLLRFPSHAEPGRVLAVMPRHLNDELLARNQDMAPHARTRIRIAFTMGVSLPGATGLAGDAPIAVARLVNWAPFRHAMAAAAHAQVGVIIDDHLHGQYVRQRFRADTGSRDYVPVRVSQADKGFDAAAWVRLFGYTAEQVAGLLGDPIRPA